MAAVVAEDANANKLQVLTNFVSSTVYSYFEGSNTYEDAFEQLDKTYSKPKNEIFARHLLSTRNQQPGETIDEFLRTLENLAKDCTFKDLTADEHRNEFIRDAFVSGLQSNAIRQRLLESTGEVTLDTAFSTARTMDLAQRSTSSYLNNNCSTVRPDVGSRDDEYHTSYTMASATRSKKKLCFFCGKTYRPRIKCPARDRECGFCGIVGHYESVCK